MDVGSACEDIRPSRRRTYLFFFVIVCVCVCTVDDFSAEDKVSGVKSCTVVHRRPEQEISHFGELCCSRNFPKDWTRMARIDQQVKMSKSHGYENRHGRTDVSDGCCCYDRVLPLPAWVCMSIRLLMFSSYIRDAATPRRMPGPTR